MRAVLLAAGLGSRLRHHSASIPKPLVPIAGRPLVSYTFDALANAAVTEIVAVTGYRSGRVRAAFDRLSPIPVIHRENPRYHHGASLSLAAARDACHNEPFLLVMSDHLLDPNLIQTLAQHEPRDGAVVAADAATYPPAYVDEATRLHVEDGRVHAIGKQLPKWTHLDAGAFHCGPATWDAFAETPEGGTLSDVFSVLARQRRMYAADITGTFWYDVDTPEDWAAAEALLRRDRPATATA